MRPELNSFRLAAKPLGADDLRAQIQIQKLTGFSLRNAEDKLKLQLGLRARRLAQLRRDDL